MYNSDIFPHYENKRLALYSSIPYVTGHSKNHDESIIITNPADTYVDIYNIVELENSSKLVKKSHVNFITESGVLEFFLIASAKSNKQYRKVNPPKKLSKLLATISGYS